MYFYITMLWQDSNLMKHLPLVQFVFKIKPVSVYPLPFRFITMYPPRVVRTCPCILSCNRERVWYYWLILKLKVTLTPTSSEEPQPGILSTNQQSSPVSFPVRQSIRAHDRPKLLIQSLSQSISRQTCARHPIRESVNQRDSQSEPPVRRFSVAQHPLGGERRQSIK